MDRRSPLPGGDFVYDGLETLVARTQRIWPFLSADHARRLASAYGTRVDDVLKTARTRPISACASAPISLPPRCTT